jgi:hypothetical protein
MKTSLMEQNKLLKDATNAALIMLEDRAAKRTSGRAVSRVEDGLTADEAALYRKMRDTLTECEALAATRKLDLKDEHLRMYMCSMGKIFRVTHICDSTEDANRTMETNKDTALIAEDRAGRCFLALQYGSIAPSAIMDDMKRA